MIGSRNKRRSRLRPHHSRVAACGSVIGEHCVSAACHMLHASALLHGTQLLLRCFEKVKDGNDTYSVECVAKFSMIHRDERSAKAAAFADAKMQMVYGRRFQPTSRLSTPCPCFQSSHGRVSHAVLRRWLSIGPSSTTSAARPAARWRLWSLRFLSYHGGKDFSAGRRSSPCSAASTPSSTTMRARFWAAAPPKASPTLRCTKRAG